MTALGTQVGRDRQGHRGSMTTHLHRYISLLTVQAVAATFAVTMAVGVPTTALAATVPAPTLGPVPIACTPYTVDSGTCLIQSRAGGLSITPHIVHPGGNFTVRFSPVAGFDDQGFDISLMGLPGDPRGRESCQELDISCTFTVPLDAVPDNTYTIYTLGFGTKQGPAKSNDYLAVVGHHALTGEVDNTSGKGIYGATISVEGAQGEMIVNTDQGGHWGLNLPGGTYSVDVASTPGADQVSKVSQCSGHVSGRECIVELTSGDGSASFVEGGVMVTDVVGPGGGSAVGPTAGGTTITITGSGFGDAGSHDEVDLVPTDGAPSISVPDATVMGDTTIRAVTPAVPDSDMGNKDELAADVEVSAYGLTSAPNPPDDEFTYKRPQITGIYPPEGSPTGGQVVTVSGQGFGSGDSVVSVLFCPPSVPPGDVCHEGRGGSDDGTSFAPDSPTRITVKTPYWEVPDDYEGNENVNVYVGVSSKAGAPVSFSQLHLFRYAVTVDSIDPSSGSPAGGAELTIHGNGFGNSQVSVMFCPPGTADPQSGPVMVSLEGHGCSQGEVDGESRFRPTTDFVIEVKDPGLGITGEISSEDIDVVVLVWDVVEGGHILGGTSAPYQQYSHAVDITKILPQSVSPAGGTELTITGDGFGTSANQVSVYFCPAGVLTPNSECLEGSKLGSPSDHTFAPENDTTIKVVDPSWQIQNGIENVEVMVAVYTKTDTGADRSVSEPYTLTYHLTVSGIKPPLAPLGGGDELVITGAGFGSSVNDVSVVFCPPGSANGHSVGCVDAKDPLGRSSFPPENDTTIRVPAPPWKIPNGASAETVYVFVDVWSVTGSLTMSESTHSSFIYAQAATGSA